MKQYFTSTLDEVEGVLTSLYSLIEEYISSGQSLSDNAIEFFSEIVGLPMLNENVSDTLYSAFFGDNELLLEFQGAELDLLFGDTSENSIQVFLENGGIIESVAIIIPYKEQLFLFDGEILFFDTKLEADYYTDAGLDLFASICDINLVVDDSSFKYIGEIVLSFEDGADLNIEGFSFDSVVDSLADKVTTELAGISPIFATVISDLDSLSVYYWLDMIAAYTKNSLPSSWRYTDTSFHAEYAGGAVHFAMYGEGFNKVFGGAETSGLIYIQSMDVSYPDEEFWFTIKTADQGIAVNLDTGGEVNGSVTSVAFGNGEFNVTALGDLFVDLSLMHGDGDVHLSGTLDKLLFSADGGAYSISLEGALQFLEQSIGDMAYEGSVSGIQLHSDGIDLDISGELSSSFDPEQGFDFYGWVTEVYFSAGQEQFEYSGGLLLDIQNLTDDGIGVVRIEEDGKELVFYEDIKFSDLVGRLIGDVSGLVEERVDKYDFTGLFDQLLFSDEATEVMAAGSDVEGSVTFWKTGASLEGVEVRAQSALQESDGGTAVMIRELVEHEDGSRTMEVWAKSDESIESLQLEFGLSTGATVVWDDAADLPSGWSSLANTEKDGEFILGGMGLTGIAAGEYLLGTITVSAPDDPDRFELSLESGALGNASSDLFDLVSVRSSTQADGGYMLEEVPGGEYELEATKASDSSMTDAVKATDALAALKLAVGMNPNVGGGDVSNYQYLAADVNGDGKVMASDALGILKMAVGLSDAPEHEWLFFGEEVEEEAMSRNEVVWNEVSPVMIEDDMLIDLVGVVKGDVDGSWVG